MVTRILAAMIVAAFSVGPVSAATVSNATPIVVAQESAASTVQGTVLDDQGAPIVNATVSLRGPSTYQTTSDAKGAFSIADVKVGLYSIHVSKPGFDSASDDLAVVAGQPQNVGVRLHISTLTSLRTIATVRSTGRGNFNTSPAATNVVTAQTFQEQGEQQVTRVLNQIPGVEASFPQTSANGAVPGAITFPNIRGALSFESASLIDGHPVSVGTFGDYVTTFLNSNMLQAVEVVKGPGASSPEANYAIGGTINFRTKDPTLTPTPDYSFGFSNHGGSFFNFSFSDTVGRLGFVVDLASEDDPSPVNGVQSFYNPTGNNGVLGFNGTNGTIIKTNTKSNVIPGTASSLTNQFSLVACCYPVSGEYNNISELVKLRYKLSSVTSLTASYLGSQTHADQNGNTSSQLPITFSPGASYAGPIAAGSALNLTNIFPGSMEVETNNEPIFQAELRTSLNNDTVLGRYYHASIDRLINAGSGVDTPSTQLVSLYGTTATGQTFNGQLTPLTTFPYFNQAENDALTGFSFEYDHPFSEKNNVTFSLDSTNSTTTSFNSSSDATFNAKGTALALTAAPFFSITLPTGSSQIFNTYRVSDYYQVSPKFNATTTLYDNTYYNQFPQSKSGTTLPDGTGFTFGTSKTSHFDERLGLEYRPRNDVAVRFSAGSAIAPPFLADLAQTPSTTFNAATDAVTLTQNAGGTLKPETAFGYDIGADYRLKDNATFVSVDGYLTNLFNHFITLQSNTGLTCASTLPIPCPGNAPPGAQTPVYLQQIANISNARFEGIELSLKRVPLAGFGFNLSGSINRGYAYDLPTCFYGINKAGQCVFDTTLALIPGQNFTGGALGAQGGFGYGGFSNQNIPYLQGDASISYRLLNGAFVELGETLYGKNNSLNEPPFGIGYVSLNYPIAKTLSLQISGDNIFNAFPGLFPIQGAGVGIPLASPVTAGNNVLPAIGASTANVLGPATYRFEITKAIGPNPAY